jgi:hypothetical protein
VASLQAEVGAEPGATAPSVYTTVQAFPHKDQSGNDLGIQALLSALDLTGGVPICLILSPVECLAMIYVYRLVLNWEGKMLQAREQKIMLLWLDDGKAMPDVADLLQVSPRCLRDWPNFRGEIFESDPGISSTWSETPVDRER